MDLGIRDRTAVVAASSKGIGRAVAEALAAEGVKVAICSRDGDACERVAKEIGDRFGVQTYGAAADLTQRDSVEQLVDAARDALGPISIAVANCGGPRPGAFEDFTEEDWREAFDLSFLSTVHLIRATLPDMRKASWGRVVSITSKAVKEPIDGLILSNAIRGSVLGLMKTLSREYGPHNILFNNVGPGLTATERMLGMTALKAKQDGKSQDQVIRDFVADSALQRVAEPREMAAVAAFLCSEQASYVTGQSVIVDGGLTKGI